MKPRQRDYEGFVKKLCAGLSEGFGPSRHDAQPLRYVGHTQPITSIVFVPYSHLVATGSFDGSVCLWDTRSHQRVGIPLPVSRAGISCIAVSPDGSYLACGSTDQSISLWSLAERRPIGRPLRSHRDWITGLCFSPDSRHLLSAGRDGNLVLWSIDARDWIASAGGLVKRNFSEEEWNKFVRPDVPYKEVFPHIPRGR